jgi:transcriptional regulator of arginine metabolism
MIRAEGLKTMTKAGKTKASSPLEALRRVLSDGGAGSQEELRAQLQEQGFDVTQSTISRCLRKLGAVKTFNPEGESIYQLTTEVIPPRAEASLTDLVTSITHNGSLIVMHTSPGSASLIALHLDRFKPGGILGTIAGDDTIFVAPPAKIQLAKVVSEIESSISGNSAS